jgi:hypothetical protein
MNLLPNKVGAEPKKLAILGALVIVLGGLWAMNRTSGPDVPPAGPSAPAVAAKAVPEIPTSISPRNVPIPGQGPRVAQRASQGRGNEGRSLEDFKPTLKLKEGVDLTKIDPSLKTGLMAKLRTLELTGGARSLFDFGQAPVPPPPPVEKIKVYTKVGPELPPVPVPAKTIPPPPPPPIPLKFYGYSGTVRSTGQRQAFFLEGEDIFVAGEGDMVKNRYKIVRIGVNSAVVEDSSNKNQQTLPLVEELQ